jgi:hypothetical protein
MRMAYEREEMQLGQREELQMGDMPRHDVGVTLRRSRRAS